jgi:hypothetical protein
MSPTRTQNVPLTKGFANRVLISLLTGRAGTRLGRKLAVVDYVGRRSGDRHLLVTGYTVEGRTVRIRVGMAKRKTWWRNFEHPHPVRLRLAGTDHEASAHAARVGHKVVVIAELSPQPVESG